MKKVRQEGKDRLRVGVGDALNITRMLKKRGASVLNSESVLSCLNTWALFSLSKQNKAKSAEKNVNKQIN